jgi:hypothetical protein
VKDSKQKVDESMAEQHTTVAPRYVCAGTVNFEPTAIPEIAGRIDAMTTLTYGVLVFWRMRV